MSFLHNITASFRKMAFSNIGKKAYNLTKIANPEAALVEPLTQAVPQATELQQTQTSPQQTPTVPLQTINRPYKSELEGYYESYVYENRENFKNKQNLEPLNSSVRQTIITNPQEMKVFLEIALEIFQDEYLAKEFVNIASGKDYDLPGLWTRYFKKYTYENINKFKNQEILEPFEAKVFMEIVNNPQELQIFENIATAMIGDRKLARDFVSKALAEQVPENDNQIPQYFDADYLVRDVLNMIVNDKHGKFTNLKETLSKQKNGNSQNRKSFTEDLLTDGILHGFSEREGKQKWDQRVMFFLSNRHLIPSDIAPNINEVLGNPQMKPLEKCNFIKQNYGHILFPELKKLIDELSKEPGTSENNPVLKWIDKSVLSSLENYLKNKNKQKSLDQEIAEGEEGKALTQGDNLTQENTTKLVNRRDNAERKIRNEENPELSKNAYTIAGLFVKNYLGDIINEINEIKNIITTKLSKQSDELSKQSDEKSLKRAEISLNRAERINLFVDESLRQAHELINPENATVKEWTNESDREIIFKNDAGKIAIPYKEIIKALAFVRESVIANSPNQELEGANITDEEPNNDAIFSEENINKYTKEYLDSYKGKGRKDLNWSPNWSALFRKGKLIDLYNEVGRIKQKIRNYQSSKNINNQENRKSLNEDLTKLFGQDINKKQKFVDTTLRQSPESINQLLLLGRQSKSDLSTAAVDCIRALYPYKDNFSVAGVRSFFDMIKPNVRNVIKSESKDRETGLSLSAQYHELVQDYAQNDTQDNAQDNILNKMQTLNKKWTDIFNQTNALKSNPQQNQELIQKNKDRLKDYKEVLRKTQDYYDNVQEVKKLETKLNQYEAEKERFKNKPEKWKAKEIKRQMDEEISKANPKSKSEPKTFESMTNKLNETKNLIEQYETSRYNISRHANQSAIRILTSMFNKMELKIAKLSNMQVKLAKIEPNNNTVDNMIMAEISKFSESFFNMLK